MKIFYGKFLSYGKLCENPSKWTNTKISRWEGIRNDWISPRSAIVQLSEENVFELTKKPHSQKDNKLVHLGTGISILNIDYKFIVQNSYPDKGSACLQLSKLLLLKFVFFIEEHLIPGSYKICYLGESHNFFFKN